MLDGISAARTRAFCTPGGDGRTIKAILESVSIPKAFVDVRNASAALFAQHHISWVEFMTFS